MKVTDQTRIQCPACGVKSRFVAHRAVDGVTQPELKAKLLDGSIGDFVCRACHQSVMVQHSLLYADLARNTMIDFADEGERSTSNEATFGPGVSAALGKLSTRRVTRYLDLVEKIIALDAGLDDRIVEVLKFVIRTPEGRDAELSLAEASPDELFFITLVGGRPMFDMLRLPRSGYTALEEQLRGSPVLDPPAPWAEIDRDWAARMMAAHAVLRTAH